jgi:hypothetical protein
MGCLIQVVPKHKIGKAVPAFYFRRSGDIYSKTGGQAVQTKGRGFWKVYSDEEKLKAPTFEAK